MKTKIFLLAVAVVGIAAAAFSPELFAAYQDPGALMVAMIAAIPARQERADLIAQNGATIEKIERATDPAEIKRLEAEWDARDAKIGELTKSIQRAEKQEIAEAGLNDPLNQRQSGRQASGRGREEHDSNAIMFRDLDTGFEVRAYRHNEALAPHARSDERGLEGLTMGTLIRGHITGKWPSRELQQRALSIGTPTAGGYTVPAPVSAQWIDLTRAHMVCSQAGALIVPMETATLQLATVDADPSVEWKAENADFTPAQHTFGRVLFTPKTAGILVKASEELIQDSVNAAEVLDTALTRAMALEMDRVMLAGSGSNGQPTGIRYTSSVGAVYPANLGAGAAVNFTNFDKFVDAVRTIRDSNYEPNAVVMAPRTAGQIAKFKDSTNQPMVPPGDYAQLKQLVTTSIPTNLASAGSPSISNVSYGVVGQFNHAVWGVRLNPVVVISREAGDQTNGAMRAYQYWVRVVMRLDVQVFRPAAFCIVHDLEA